MCGDLCQIKRRELSFSVQGYSRNQRTLYWLQERRRSSPEISLRAVYSAANQTIYRTAGGVHDKGTDVLYVCYPTSTSVMLRELVFKLDIWQGATSVWLAEDNVLSFKLQQQFSRQEASVFLEL